MVRIGVVGFCMCMGSGAEEEKRGGIGGVGHVFGKRGRNTRWGDLLRPRIVQIKTRERERGGLVSFDPWEWMATFWLPFTCSGLFLFAYDTPWALGKSFQKRVESNGDERTL